MYVVTYKKLKDFMEKTPLMRDFCSDMNDSVCVKYIEKSQKKGIQVVGLLIPEVKEIPKGQIEHIFSAFFAGFYVGISTLLRLL